MAPPNTFESTVNTEIGRAKVWRYTWPPLYTVIYFPIRQPYPEWQQEPRIHTFVEQPWHSIVLDAHSDASEQGVKVLSSTLIKVRLVFVPVWQHTSVTGSLGGVTFSWGSTSARLTAYLPDTVSWNTVNFGEPPSASRDKEKCGESNYDYLWPHLLPARNLPVQTYIEREIEMIPWSARLFYQIYSFPFPINVNIPASP